MLGELTRQLTLTDQPVRLYHYRDRDQYEVDAVLESASGEAIACVVKAAKTVDFRGIRRLSRCLSDRLRAWPVSTLWTLTPRRWRELMARIRIFGVDNSQQTTGPSGTPP